MCNYLTARCYLEANELNEALQTINLIEIETDNTTFVLENESFDDTPTSVCMLEDYVYFEFLSLFVARKLEQQRYF